MLAPSTQRNLDHNEHVIALRFSKVSVTVEGLQREPLISYRSQMVVRTVLQSIERLKDVNAGRRDMNPGIIHSIRQDEADALSLLHEDIRAKIQYLELEEAAAAADRIINEAFT